jgi:hypothetical protein
LHLLPRTQNPLHKKALALSKGLHAVYVREKDCNKQPHKCLSIILGLSKTDATSSPKQQNVQTSGDMRSSLQQAKHSKVTQHAANSWLPQSYPHFTAQVIKATMPRAQCKDSYHQTWHYAKPKPSYKATHLHTQLVLLAAVVMLHNRTKALTKTLPELLPP